MSAADEHALLRKLYLPPVDEFVLVDVPQMRFAAIDGRGAADRSTLDTAVKWLFKAILPVKQIAKERMGRNFVEPPLEALWWADDMQDFVCGHREKMNWRMMIVTPDWMTQAMLDEGIERASARFGEPPSEIRFVSQHEGLSAQIMHIGPHAEESAIIERLHRDYLPAHGLTPHGHHHEIYLNDPKRVAPEKCKTVLRQPVTKSGESHGSLPSARG